MIVAEEVFRRNNLKEGKLENIQQSCSW